MPYCIKCGELNNENANYCRKCGTPLKTQMMQDNTAEDNWNCYVCNQPLNKARVCLGCGTEQWSLPNSNLVEAKKKISWSGVSLGFTYLKNKDHDEFCRDFCALGYGYYGEYTLKEIEDLDKKLNIHITPVEKDAASRRFKYWKQQNLIKHKAEYERLYKLVEQRKKANTKKIEDINREIWKLSDTIYGMEH